MVVAFTPPLPRNQRSPNAFKVPACKSTLTCNGHLPVASDHTTDGAMSRLFSLALSLSLFLSPGLSLLPQGIGDGSGPPAYWPPTCCEAFEGSERSLSLSLSLSGSRGDLQALRFNALHKHSPYFHRKPASCTWSQR